jgi:SAM-dependent methyltransferase
MQNFNKREVKFNTRDPKLLQVWDEIQHIQTDFCFQQEVSVYYMSDYWLNSAKTVLDVGTGNGYYLNKLLQLFPNKKYTGIDIAGELLEIASSKISNYNVELKKKDYFDVDGAFDFVIMRLFWQHLHLSKFEEALIKLAKITKIGGSAIIVDACDQFRCFVPELPKFREVIMAYAEQQRKVGKNRNIIETIKEWADKNESWRVEHDLTLILPSTIPGNLNLYHRIYKLWIGLFEILREIDMDFEPAKTELANWIYKTNTYTHAGIRLILLNRIA